VEKVGKSVEEIIGDEIKVVSIPVTSSIKMDLGALVPELGIAFSNAMPAVAQLIASVEIQMRVPPGYSPGEKFTEDQERLHRAVRYVADVVDVANTERLEVIAETLRDLFSPGTADEL